MPTWNLVHVKSGEAGFFTLCGLGSPWPSGIAFESHDDLVTCPNCIRIRDAQPSLFDEPEMKLAKPLEPVEPAEPVKQAEPTEPATDPMSFSTKNLPVGHGPWVMFVKRNDTWTFLGYTAHEEKVDEFLADVEEDETVQAGYVEQLI